MARPKKTLDDILKTVENLSAALVEERNPQPENTITPMQFAELKKCTKSSAGETLLRLHRAGKMQREKWRNTHVYWESN
jgi:hypothetical protein